MIHFKTNILTKLFGNHLDKHLKMEELIRCSECSFSALVEVPELPRFIAQDAILLDCMADSFSLNLDMPSSSKTFHSSLLL